MTVHKVKIEPITAERFAPFGELLGPVDREPDRVSLEGALSTWFSSFTVDGPPRVAYAQYEFIQEPTAYRLRHLEHHRGITQAVVPLAGKPSVLTVAPPTPWGTEPALDDIVAFLLDGTCGFVMHELTWHLVDSPLVFPIYPPGLGCVYIHGDNTYADIEAGTYEDTKIIDTLERDGVVLALEW